MLSAAHYGQKTHPFPLNVMTGSGLKDPTFPLVHGWQWNALVG
jgi:hypothetical protein